MKPSATPHRNQNRICSTPHKSREAQSEHASPHACVLGVRRCRAAFGKGRRRQPAGITAHISLPGNRHPQSIQQPPPTRRGATPEGSRGFQAPDTHRTAAVAEQRLRGQRQPVPQADRMNRRGSALQSRNQKAVRTSRVGRGLWNERSWINDHSRPTPSSNRTCRFPASGFSRTVSCVKHAQGEEIQSLDGTSPVWHSHSASLAGTGSFPGNFASLMVSSLLGSFVLGRVLTRPISFRFLLSPLRTRQGPFAPRALPRFNATMSLSDFPVSSTPLIDSRRTLMASSRHPRQGSPSLPNSTFPARCPHSPRRSPSLLSNVSSQWISGFGISDRLADLSWCNEADTGSLALRLTGLIRGASTPRLLRSLSASLHAGRSVGMMNTFQFIGFVGGAGAPDCTDFTDGLESRIGR